MSHKLRHRRRHALSFEVARCARADHSQLPFTSRYYLKRLSQSAGASKGVCVLWAYASAPTMGKQYELTHTATRAKTGAGRRAIDSRLPKIIETPKSLLALKGHATSAICTAVMHEIHMLKKPHCRKLQRKNDILPFEAGGEAHLENLARLNDCSLFALVNHTKKRPHNLILGRTFGFRILDMVEFGVTNFMPSASFPNAKSTPGSKPLILFNGDDFDSKASTRDLKSLLLDIFRGPDDVKSVSLSGVDRAIVFTLQGDSRVLFRQYAIELRKAKNSALPKVVLNEAGPHFDLDVRRSQSAPDALLKEAMKRAKDPRTGFKTKNVSRDDMGDKKGRVHVGHQDLSSLVLARMKGLNKKRGAHVMDEDKELNPEGDQDDEEGESEAPELIKSPPKRSKLVP